MNINQTNPDDSLQALGLSLPDDKSLAIKHITQTYLDSLYQDDYVEPEKIANDLAQMVKHEFALYNESAITGGKWHIPSKLLPEQIAMAIPKKTTFLEEVRNIVDQGMHGWKYYRNTKTVPSKARVSGPDILQQYAIKDWSDYEGKSSIRGLIRDNPIGNPCLGIAYN